MARSFQPELILVAAGFDAARGDPLGDCDVTPDGFAFLTQELKSLDCPVVIALEGGYNVPSVKYCFVACVAALCGVCEIDGTAFAEPQQAALVAIGETIAAQTPHWPAGTFEIAAPSP